MKTEDLIRALASDGTVKAPSPERTCARAILLAVPLAAAVFLVILRPRPDFMESLDSLRFLSKFLVTLTLFATMAYATMHLARPTGRASAWSFVLTPVLVVLVAAMEWLVLPPGTRLPAMLGHNALICMTAIPVIGLLPLGVFIMALRQCAPTAPALAGTIAGLMAGGLAATFYASHCTDDSPLFVALWYSLAVGVLAIVGGLAGRWFVRW
ncbi:NrsF family protein [Oryzibacter oryziterrae]|uniref:NrsF family protein n=1 Tax=Oryzibacter oryziterrae TaxID=2766474 RepID=UPI001F30FFE5|nr:NrsF family protein [Oryzibacter oryziterrae]